MDHLPVRPDPEGSRKELLNLIDIRSLKEILDAFTTTTGLMANVVDVHGRSIFSKKDMAKCCQFCKLIMAMEQGPERCQNAYERAAPIVVDGKHLGSIICGQVLMWEPEEFFWIELREMNKSLTSDFKELFKAVEELPVVSGDMVQAASYLLYIIANFITRSGWEQKQRKEELLKQKLLLREELENRKKLEDQLGQMFLYSMDRETSLMEAVREGKDEDAEQLLAQVTSDIILGSKGDMEVICARAVELVVITSRAMHAALYVLRPIITHSSSAPKGLIVIGTVAGDLHDIGKNMVAMMLTGYGYTVVDLGIDVTKELFAEAVVKYKPDILAMSALLTTTMPEMENVIEYLEKEGLRERVKITIGGSPITMDFAREIGADAYSENVFDAMRAVDDLMEGRIGIYSTKYEG